MDSDRRRTRRVGYIVGIGVILGLVGATAVGLSGGTGTAGLATLLLLTAAGSSVAALYAIVTAAIDDMRGRPTSWRRPVLAAALFAASAAMMAMVAGIGG